MRWKDTWKSYIKKGLTELDYYNGVVSHPEQTFWSVKSSGP